MDITGNDAKRYRTKSIGASAAYFVSSHAAITTAFQKFYLCDAVLNA